MQVCCSCMCALFSAEEEISLLNFIGSINHVEVAAVVLMIVSSKKKKIIHQCHLQVDSLQMIPQRNDQKKIFI